MAQAARRPGDFDQDVGELIEESDRQIRKSRELLSHLDRALARSERVLRRSRPDLAQLRREAQDYDADEKYGLHGSGGGGVAAG